MVKYKAIMLTPEQNEAANQIVEIYSRFKVKLGPLIDLHSGNRVTRFEFELMADTKISKITMLRDDVSLMLSVPKIRIICPIPGKNAVAFEIPNNNKEFLEYNSVVLRDENLENNENLPILLGKNLNNKNTLLELSKAPHLLIGGTTCSGKTNLLKNIITNLIAFNSNLKLLLINPQKQEFEIFENSQKLLNPIIDDEKQALESIRELCNECDKRQKLFLDKSVKNIDAYNDIAENPLYKIVAVIDEFSPLIAYEARDFEYLISNLAQRGRPCGIHIILSTNKLSPTNITGIIKANMPTRIAFQAQNPIESRTIIDCCDAECLLSKGDILLCRMLAKPERIQVPLIDEEQIKNILG